ncbi:NAD(P)H-binding protein [Streptomyces sp. NBC_00285]|uniref:NAD(P)H-binding protein n=1 Tax=Streptomyces sp. NBC_00285 TaxID=2975700 RepID=UPI002E2D05F9|nr:NAD(P)H-binding protein [Streptomyces sp. NBC_00285]
MVAMILVTGATGTIGRDVVRQLVARGEKVRALTRDPGTAHLPPGVEAVRGHHRDPDSVASAMAGADAAFLVGVFGPDDADSDRGMVEAARAAGVRRVVKLSAVRAGDPRTGLGGIAHGHGEEAVRESGLEWVILRPSAFASNTLRWAEAVRAGEPVPNMLGEGRQGVVDPRDVAEIAVAALLGPEHVGRTYTLTGPDTVSPQDQAATLGEVLGGRVELRDLTPPQTRELLVASGWSEESAEGMLRSIRFVGEGGNEVVTGDVEEVLGRPARTYRAWAEDHREAFGEDPRRRAGGS